MIYFIQAGESGPVKIGRARNPISRLAELQIGSAESLHLRASLDVDDVVEGNLHKTLAACRIRGEWFDTNEIYVNVAMACAMAGHVWDPICEECRAKAHKGDSDDRGSATNNSQEGIGKPEPGSIASVAKVERRGPEGVQRSVRNDGAKPVDVPASAPRQDQQKDVEDNGVERGLGGGGRRTLNRRSREAYNAYQRDLMRKRRAEGRA